MQELRPNNHQTRRTFSEWAQNVMATYPDFLMKILLNYLAHFWSNKYVHEQHLDPQAIVETPLHPQK